MKYLHKYLVEGAQVFILTDKATKPSGTFSVKQEDWRGRALGRSGTVVAQLENLTFSKKDTPEEAPEVKEKKASIAAAIDKLASELETEAPLVALALDQVSDFVDPNC